MSEDWRLSIEAELALAQGSSRYRERAKAPAAGDLINFSSNDYLGYAAESFPQAELRWGAGASRLVNGTHVSHRRAEAALASWLGQSDALTTSSGFTANLALLGAIAGEGDVIFSDQFCHASLIDACRLSRATTAVFRHNDLNHLDELLEQQKPKRRGFILTESYFSMDGDVAPLEALAKRAREKGFALIVDESHAIGVFGENGRGLASSVGDVLAARTFGFGKALGLMGGAIVAPSAVLDLVWNYGRSFIYSTAMSPALAEAVSHRVFAIQSDEPRREMLWNHCARFKAALESQIRLPKDLTGPIFPIVIGSDERCLEVADALKAGGYLSQAIRPPTVPEGTARLRVVIRASHSEEAIDSFASHLLHCLGLKR